MGFLILIYDSADYFINAAILEAMLIIFTIFNPAGFVVV
jgi:hypothetical protein